MEKVDYSKIRNNFKVLQARKKELINSLEQELKKSISNVQLNQTQKPKDLKTLSEFLKESQRK